ncbi:MAG: ROK family protein, partial [Burkholderiales bacterium]|nr:ROK family protein [Burkholderiales bacterium]
LARALAVVVNLLDPDVIVLGGGLSRLPHLYERVPALWGDWVFGATPERAVRTRLLPSRHGDASGVRGAAWLGARVEAALARGHGLGHSRPHDPPHRVAGPSCKTRDAP